MNVDPFRSVSATLHKGIKAVLRIRDPGSEIRDPDPGWVKIRIRDKHLGSATLHKGLRFGMALHWVQVVVETSQNCEYCIVVYHYQLIKGTVSRDFLLLVFFTNQFPPSPRVSH